MGVIRKLNDKVNIVGTNLKRIREQKNISQPDLCTKMQLLGVNMRLRTINALLKILKSKLSVWH